MNLYLTGFMASGKSTLGDYLSEYSGRSFRDLDRCIVQRAGQSVREIFESEGESGFRDRETAMLEELDREDRLIVATGGGIIERPENRKILQAAFTVFLDWKWENLSPWLQSVSRHQRPLLEKSEEEVQALFERRLPLYREVATETLEVHDPEEGNLGTVLDSLCERIHEALLCAEGEP
ncbi:MAG: shikimate kinase [Candidatus Krumholzibacteria bacterium]|jgi:shikimate kinase|nr:shikimate kinase [Candidatus Krumholzibacteria bacterium]MDP6796582.1 shikimate kinase [Candidatus Krumholzibacteria bacterium]MDP7020754.1 shikimate kinase [Candidatus Krumholzibacteria bacterium]